MNKINKAVLRKTLLVSIPLLLLWSGIIAYNLKVEQNHVITSLEHENEIRDSNTEFLIDNYIDEIIENLKLIRDSDEFKEYISNHSQETFNEVKLMFERVMINKADYDQLRLIDENGYEIIRVDNDDNEVIVCKEEELQDKSDRYYFKESKMLKYDEIFISPLDLNIENGEIEIPYKPMVRFATPIYDNEDKLKGILIINYKAEYFVKLLEAHEVHKELEKFWFYIVNRNGEFILHQEEKNNFSFMFRETKDLNFSKIDTTAWDQIERYNKGSLINNKELVTYYDILGKTRDKNPKYKERWIAIHQMDISTLFSFKAFLDEMILIKNLTVIFIILVFSFIYGYISENLRKKDDRLEVAELIAGSTNDGVVITDENTNITYVNSAYEEITGYRAEEVFGMQPRDFKSGKQDELFYKNMWSEINLKGNWEGTLWDKKKNGVLYPQKMRIIAMKNKKKKGIHRYVSIFTDMSMEKNKTDMLKDINSTDGNFFIPNEEMMLQLLKKSIEDEEFSFMVLYISIENYNQLITSFLEFESISSEIFIDLVKPMIHEDDFIAQTGRNIFTVIIGTNHIKGDPHKFVDEIHKNLSRTIEVKGKELFFKTRIGASFWPHDTDDIKKLLLNSIIALEWTIARQSKKIAFFSENMIHELNHENEIEGYLKNAIGKSEFYMVYQPQIDSLTNEIVGIEALIRWENEKLGLISPAIFIPIAERSNMIIEIGYWIINQVCKDLKDMVNLANGKMKNIRCAINLSAVQMQEGTFLEKFFEIINDNKVNFNCLEIEITEGLLLLNESKNIDILNELRQIGITIAIDDFGIGYSSLSYLKTLPIDKIKIDRSFIKDYPENDDGKLLDVLVYMADFLDISVLAEGAETEEQIGFLKSIGCRYIQGYYYSKPLDKDSFIKYLNSY